MDMLTLAESRIVKAFVTATETKRRRSCLTRTSIPGIGSKQRDLVRHVIETCVNDDCDGFVNVSELPYLGSDAEKSLRLIAIHAENDLVALKVRQLSRLGVIWFNANGPGRWEIAPSLVDKYEHDAELARLIHRTEQQRRRERLHGNGRLRVVH